LKPIRERFSEIFGAKPGFEVIAPGRINLIGEHIDYLDGLVMPAAIDRSIYAAVAPNQSDEIRIWTSLTGAGRVKISLSDLTKRSGKDFWMNYPIGVLSLYRDRGIDCPGFDILIDADLPTGAGLSSSAALEITIALVIEELSGGPGLDGLERARICQQAEHDFAGVPCGMMDQLAVGMSRAGCALMIDCRDHSIQSIPFPEDIAIVVSDTRVKHSLGDGEYRKRREECEAAIALLPVSSLRDASPAMIDEHKPLLGDLLYRRARHAVTEMERVRSFAGALENRDHTVMSRTLLGSHLSLRDDFEVSCPELDALVDAAYAFGPGRGLIGARMTGGGFGGSTISLVRREAADDLIQHLQSAYFETFRTMIEPFVTVPSAGARVVYSYS